MTKRSEPVRTCVGCRQRAAKSDLVRVVGATTVTGETEVRPDPRGRLPGRGAHLHPTEECVALAIRRKAFPRALRLSSAPDLTALQRWIAAYSAHQNQAPEIHP